MPPLSAVTRRFWALGLALALVAGGPARAGQAEAPAQGRISHAIAMQGAPALPPDFKCLPYANPAAAKGGTLHLGEYGAFDNLNPYGVNAGTTAAGIAGPVYESLMARSY